jgi:hypothetical protein
MRFITRNLLRTFQRKAELLPWPLDERTQATTKKKQMLSQKETPQTE